MWKAVRKEGLSFRCLQRILTIVLATVLGVCTALYPLRAGAEPLLESTAKKQAAIVIDDFGNDMLGTKEMLALPIPFTIAVMPFLPTTKRDAELAHASGRDVIVHLPMEPVRGKKSWLGPGAITIDLSNDEVRSRVIAAVDDVPHAIGINNHMGSKVTADERIMRIVLEVCKERGLFILDSRTSPRSVFGKLAKEMGVKTAENNLFFDDVYTTRHIAKQMTKFQEHLRAHETCIAIGHVGMPGQKTAEVIKQAIPALRKEHVEFVPVAKLVQ